MPRGRARSRSLSRDCSESLPSALTVALPAQNGLWYLKAPPNKTDVEATCNAAFTNLQHSVPAFALQSRGDAQKLLAGKRVLFTVRSRPPAAPLPRRKHSPRPGVLFGGAPCRRVVTPAC